jgi:hypothetical protein
MKNPIRIASVLLLAVSLAGCEGPCQKLSKITGPATPAMTSGTADFTTYVAVGTSISAGYQSGGIVAKHQVRSFPALFAKQIGKTVLESGGGTFSFPAANGNGIGPLTRLLSLGPPVIISNAGLPPGAPVNIGQAGDYQNLGISGSLAFDFADSSAYHSAPNALGRTVFTMFDITTRGHGTVAQQMLRQGPTFISFEYGANEVLGSTAAGTSALVFPPSTYTAILNGALAAIHATVPNAKLALFNVPSVTSIPLCTTFKPYTRGASGAPVALIGSSGPLDPRDLVLLTAGTSLAGGTGFPVGSYNYVYPGVPGNGNPLPDNVVLTVAEQATINAAVDAMNTAIDAAAVQPWIAKVDLHGLLRDIAANGYVIGNTRYSSAFLSGGLFSLDGAHPNDLAHAIIANTMIDAVNARFGSTVPKIDLTTAMTPSSSFAVRPGTPSEDVLQGGLQIEGLDESFRQLFAGRR